jgi:putative ABC transport system permease protein
MMRTRTSLLALLSSQFGGQRAAAGVIVVTIAGVGFLAVGAPHALETLVSQELTFQISQLPAATRDLSASPIGVVSMEPGESIAAVWGPTVDSVAAVRDSVPTAARGLLGTGELVASTSAVSTGMSHYDIGTTDPVSRIGIVAGPDLLDRVRIVDGIAPQEADPATARVYNSGRTVQPGDPLLPIQIALSRSTAATLNWPIGQTRMADPEPSNHRPYFQLVGIVEAIDDGADYWQHVPLTTLTADVFDDGNRRPVATATAIVSPLTWPTISSLYNFGPATIQRLTVWFPLDGTQISGTNASNVRDELRQTAARVVSIGQTSAFTEAPRSAFTTSVVDRLDTTLARSDATTSVLLVAAAGPLGVAIAVLALASRLIAQRRRDTLSLIASRGGSDLQLRSVLAAEGLAYGVPAAAVGLGLGALVFGGPLQPVSLLAAAIAAVAPAFVLAVSAAPGSLRRARSDIAAAPRTRTRRIVDLVVAVLATAVVAVIILRGPTLHGIDPVLVLAPVLVSVAASLLVLRLYSVPLRLVESRLAQRDQAAALLGSVRGSRDPAAGLAPVLAMIVAVSVATFAGTMVATLATGTVSAAQESEGGDVRLAGPQFVDSTIDAVRAIDGVTVVTPIEVIGSGTLKAGRASVPVEVIVADTAALSAQQDGLAGRAPEISATASDELTIVVSSSVAAKISGGGDPTLSSRPVTIASTAASIAGSGADQDWILVDIAQRDSVGREGFAPRVLVISTDSEAGTQAVLDWASTTYGSGVQAATMASAIADIRASPFVAGLSTALLIVILIVAALCTFCVVLMTTIAAGERTRLLALLRTLGFSRPQSRTLIAWELGPVAIAALIAGVALGVALPLIVLAGVDVTPFTGGVNQPTLVIDPVLLFATIAGFVVIIATATIVAIAATRESPIAAVLRSGEE